MTKDDDRQVLFNAWIELKQNIPFAKQGKWVCAIVPVLDYNMMSALAALPWDGTEVFFRPTTTHDGKPAMMALLLASNAEIFVVAQSKRT